MWWVMFWSCDSQQCSSKNGGFSSFSVDPQSAANAAHYSPFPCLAGTDDLALVWFSTTFNGRQAAPKYTSNYVEKPTTQKCCYESCIFFKKCPHLKVSELRIRSYKNAPFQNGFLAKNVLVMLLERWKSDNFWCTYSSSFIFVTDKGNFWFVTKKKNCNCSSTIFNSENREL